MAIVDSADDAIVGRDLDGTILTWNAAAERLYGYTAAEAIGRPISMLVPPDLPDEVAEVMARLNRGESVEQFETVRLHKDGTPIDVSLTLSPVRDGHGTIVGAASFAREVGERRRADEKMRELVAIVETSRGRDRQPLDRRDRAQLEPGCRAAARLHGRRDDRAARRARDRARVDRRPRGAPRTDRDAESAPARSRRRCGARTAPRSTSRSRRRRSPTTRARSSASRPWSATSPSSATSRTSCGSRRRWRRSGSLAGGIAHDFNNLLR